MRKLWLVIAVVVLAAGGLVWWLVSEPEAGAGPSTPSPDDGTAALDSPFVHAPASEDAVDAGVGRVSGRVLDENGAPVSGVRVRLYAPGPGDRSSSSVACATWRSSTAKIPRR